MKLPRVIYDASIDVAYIYFVESVAPGGVAMTYSCNPQVVKGMINLDFDPEGRLLGLEILDASHYLPELVLQQGARNVE